MRAVPTSVTHSALQRIALQASAMDTLIGTAGFVMYNIAHTVAVCYCAIALPAGGSSSACIASGSTGTLMYRARRWRSRTCAGGDAAGVRRGSLSAFGIVLAAA